MKQPFRIAAASIISAGLIVIVYLFAGLGGGGDGRLVKLKELGGDFGCPGCNVVLITVDTVRADQLHCYGYDRETTPRICSVADEGVVFENAYSAAPVTMPALVSIMTGGLVANNRLDAVMSNWDLKPTLAARFVEGGYLTAGFTDHAGIGDGSRGSSLPARDFRVFENMGVGRRKLTSSKLTDRVLEWIKGRDDQKLFLWVHYFDPHMNYSPPPDLEERFGFAKGRCGRVVPNMDIEQIRAVEKDLTPRETACLVALHDAETFYTDRHVGRLLDGLEQAMDWEKTIVVISADHGEEFKERTRIGHEWTVYDELIRVPLIIRNPRRRAAVRVREPISTMSLFHLLPQMVAGEALELPTEVVARSYHYYRTDHTEPTRPIEYALVEDGLKAIVTPARGAWEVYDLAADPGERNNISDAPASAAIKARLSAWIERNTVQVPPPRAELMRDHEATNEVLKRLGYVRD